MVHQASGQSSGQVSYVTCSIAWNTWSIVPARNPARPYPNSVGRRFRLLIELDSTPGDGRNEPVDDFEAFAADFSMDLPGSSVVPCRRVRRPGG